MKKKKSAAKASKNSTRKKQTVRKAADSGDVLEIIREHHKPLKQLIKTMKDSEAEFDEIQAAFQEFAPLLIQHAKPEEQALYTRMKESEEDVRCEGFEGETEHAIADRLVEEIKETSDEDEFRARVKVLAELVEHHIEEEEEDMFPDLRKEFDLEERVAIGAEYLSLYQQFSAEEKAA